MQLVLGKCKRARQSGLDGPKLILHSMCANMYTIHFSQHLSPRLANSQSQHPEQKLPCPPCVVHIWKPRQSLCVRQVMCFRVQGLRFQGLGRQGFRALGFQGLGFQGLGFQGLGLQGFRVYGFRVRSFRVLGFRGLGFRCLGLRFFFYRFSESGLRVLRFQGGGLGSYCFVFQVIRHARREGETRTQT